MSVEYVNESMSTRISDQFTRNQSSFITDTFWMDVVYSCLDMSTCTLETIIIMMNWSDMWRLEFEWNEQDGYVLIPCYNNASIVHVSC